MSFLTGTNWETIYASTAMGTAKTTFTTEVAINDTAGMGPQPSLPPSFWMPSPRSAIGIGIGIRASGILSSTATPTYTFTVRLGAAASITSSIMLGSAAVATASGVTNQPWLFEGYGILTALGVGALSSIRGTGMLICPGLTVPNVGLGANASLTTPLSTTLDTTITNFVNFNVACSASSASNSIQLQQLLVFGLN